MPRYCTSPGAETRSIIKNIPLYYMASCKYCITMQYRAVQYYTNTDRWWVPYEFYMTEEKFILPEANPRAIWIFSRSYKIHIAQTTGQYLFYYMTWEDVMINNKKSIARTRNMAPAGLNVVVISFWQSTLMENTISYHSVLTISKIAVSLTELEGKAS